MICHSRDYSFSSDNDHQKGLETLPRSFPREAPTSLKVSTMILPTKHVPVNETLLGIGALLLLKLKRPKTVSALWTQAQKQAEVATFTRFILALDLLYMLGAIEMRDGLVMRAK